MKIAVTYENGQIFRHFGKTEQFKLYDVSDGRIVSEQVAGTYGAGHGEEHSCGTHKCGGHE